MPAPQASGRESLLSRLRSQLRPRSKARFVRPSTPRGVTPRRRHRDDSMSYQSLEQKTLLASLIASYGADFPSPGHVPSNGWQYQWNAPINGDLATGAIDAPDTEFQALRFTGKGTIWTPDGDLDPGNQPASSFLRLAARGGHPGIGPQNAISDVSRYAIATYTVAQSGHYAIVNSFVGLNPNNALAVTDGVEYRVFVNRETPLNIGIVEQNSNAYFDTTLGYLAAGDTIHVAYGASGNHAFDYFTTDFDIVRNDNLEHILGTFSEDFLSESPGEYGWKYLWNAPINWQANGVSGNPLTGSIDDNTSYRALQSANPFWTADGDANGLNSSPDYFLRLHSGGGHPGIGYTNPAFQNRYAIAAFTVEHSGLYGIRDSFVRVPNAASDGVEVRVSLSDDSRFAARSQLILGNDSGEFDTRLGYLEKGDTIYVAFGANQNQRYDSFQTDFSIVRILPREAPDLSLLDHDGEVVSVNDSRDGQPGATPDDGQDDRQAIQNALDYAKTNGSNEIYFEPGVYNLSGDDLADGKPLFALIQMNDLVINGNGSTLIVDDHTRALFHTHTSNNIIFQDLTIDYAEEIPANEHETKSLYRPLTFTQGIISEIDRSENSFVLTVNTEAFVAPDESFERSNSIGWGYALNRYVDGRLKEGTEWHYSTLSVEPLSSSRFKITTFHTNGLANGDRYVLQRRHNVSLFGIYGGSSNITVSGVTAYSAPSVFIGSNHSDTINVLDSHVSIRPDDWPSTPNTQRWKSTNGDGVHIQSNRIGAWVEGSSFNGTGDDVMNFYTRPMAIHEVVSDRSFTLVTVVPHNIANVPRNAIQHGDRLAFFNPIEGRVIEEVRVTDVLERWVQNPANPSHLVRMQTVTVDQSVEGLVAADYTDSDGYLNDTTVFNLNAMRSSMVQDNLISNGRRYGNFLMTDNAQLIDNVYEGLSDEAIAAHNEPGWPLGPFSSDILIQGNEFINNGFSRHYLDDSFHTGVVAIKAARYVDPFADENSTRRADHLVDEHDYIFRNIQILDNVFYHWNKAAVSVRNSKLVTIDGNSVTEGLTNAVGTNSESPFDIHFSSDVTLANNAYAGDANPVNTSESNPLNPQGVQTVHNGGLKTWLKFDRGGVLKDSSDNGSEVSFHNAGITQEGRFDSAPIFNTTNSIEVNDRDSSKVDQRTISLWFSADVAERSSHKQVLYEQGNSQNGMNIYIHGGRLYVGSWAASNYTTFLSTPVSSGQWNHVALVIDSQSVKLRGYLNGVRFDSGFGGSIPPTVGNVQLGRVGNWGTRFHTGAAAANSNGFKGRIDEVRIYERSLGDAEVFALASL